MVDGLAAIFFTFKKKDFIAWATYVWCRLFRGTKSKCHHVGMVIDGVSLDIIEAVAEGFKISNLDKYIIDDKVALRVYEMLYLTEEEKQLLVEFMLSNEGIGYDFLGFASFVIPFIHQVDKRFYCSEIIKIACDELNIPFAPYRKEKGDKKISPAEIEDFMSNTENNCSLIYGKEVKC